MRIFITNFSPDEVLLSYAFPSSCWYLVVSSSSLRWFHGDMLHMNLILYELFFIISILLGGAFAGLKDNDGLETGFEKNKHFMRGGPHVFIIGAQKCGTTSLYHLLMNHPSFCPSVYKEIHYFDRTENWRKGAGYYLAHFKTSSAKCTLDKSETKKMNITTAGSYAKPIYLDATPDYFTNLLAPARIFQSFPAKERAKKKFILIVREPVSREFSWYNHRVRLCTNAMREELRRQRKSRSGDIAAMTNKVCADKHCKYLKCQENAPNVISKKEEIVLANFTEYYQSGGLVPSKSQYMTHLNHWLKYFPRNQFFIINLSTLLTNTTDSVHRLTRFLGIPSFPTDKMNNGKIVLPHENSARVFTTFDCAVRNELYPFYAQENTALLEFMRKSVPSNGTLEPPFPAFEIQPCRPGQLY